MSGFEIPVERLSEEVLQKIIEEFVLREGTDYGVTEYSLSDKVQQVRTQITKGKIKVLFDPDDETVSLEVA